MHERYLVSVIIPVYNSSAYLQDILSDVINQTYKELQIIVIDDGSRDESLAIAREYAMRDARLQVFSYENKGQSRARNIGLSVAEGLFVRFVDSDDRIPLDSIENMVEAITAFENIDLIIGNFVSDSQYGIYLGNDLKNEVITDKQLSELLLKAPRAFYYGVPWNKLYRRDIIEKYNIQFDENISWCEDLLFNLEYYKQSKKIAILNCQNGVYQYFIRDTGVTGSIKQDRKEEARIEELRYKKLQEYFAGYQIDEEFQLGWKYINFYYRLTNCVKKEIGGKSIRNRYAAFSEMLSAKEAYQYICMRECDYDPRVSKMLKKAIEKKHILRVFLFFLFKSWLSAHFSKAMSQLRRRIGLRIPTDY